MADICVFVINHLINYKNRHLVPADQTDILAEKNVISWEIFDLFSKKFCELYYQNDIESKHNVVQKRIQAYQVRSVLDAVETITAVTGSVAGMMDGSTRFGIELNIHRYVHGDGKVCGVDQSKNLEDVEMYMCKGT